MWWKQNKWKVLLPVFLLVILTAAFWYGGNSPGMQGWTVEAPKSAETLESKDAQSPDTETETEPEEEAPTEEEPQEERASQPETGIESRPGGTEGGMSAQEKLEAAEEIAGGSQGPIDSHLLCTSGHGGPKPCYRTASLAGDCLRTIFACSSPLCLARQ